MWSTKYGIILERATETTTSKVGCNSLFDMHSSFGNSLQLPTVFALLHPMDDVSPVLAKHGTCDTWSFLISCYVQVFCLYIMYLCPAP